MPSTLCVSWTGTTAVASTGRCARRAARGDSTSSSSSRVRLRCVRPHSRQYRRLGRQKTLHSVSASNNPYDEIKANRAARKAAKEKEAAEEGEAPSDFACQAGDIVEVSWECADPATGALLDSSTKGGIPRNVSFQMGNDAGFQPKNGLKLAFSYVCEGLKVGEAAQVVSRPNGRGWLRAYEVLSEDGMLLAQLNPEERGEAWAEQEAVFSVEVVNIQPPRGRVRGGRR